MIFSCHVFNSKSHGQCDPYSPLLNYVLGLIIFRSSVVLKYIVFQRSTHMYKYVKAVSAAVGLTH